MPRRSCAFGFLLLVCGFAPGREARADLIVVSPLDGSSTPPVHDLGDITSTGGGGRQLVVEPANPFGYEWRYFPPHDILPNVFPEPTPATPAQSAIQLAAGAPLEVAIPQLSHMPMLAEVHVAYQVIGHTIIVNASLNELPASTDTIYGPQEYLLAIGSLDAGDYQLVFNFDFLFEGRLTFQDTGFVHFQVGGAPSAGFSVVPEPAGLMLALSALAGFVLFMRRHLNSRQR